MRRSVLAVLAVVGFATAAGCSKSGQLEDKIAEQFQKEVSISNVKVRCPEGVKAEKGEEVQCVAEGDFTALGVTSKQLTLFIKFKADNSFEVTDFSADGVAITITTSGSSSNP